MIFKWNFILTSENAGLTLPEAELRLEVFGQEHDEARHYHEFHTSAQARHHVHRVLDKPPHRYRYVCNVINT